MLIIYVKTKIMIGLKKKKKKKTNVEKKRLMLIIVGLVFGLKFLPIIFFYCIWQIKHLYFFEKNQRCNLCLPT